MPRTLPWMKAGGSSTTVARSRKPTTTTIKPPKRQRSEDSDSETGKKVEATSIARSSSPPPDPPLEEFMDDGIEHDDKYRMVEDEFLTTAQKWTVHLHAAEYKRQEKLAKARNADTINSISRPVTARMPDQTRRRVEGVARAKAQKTAVAKMAKKEATSDSDGAGDDMPYAGTFLHGLMDSPRKKVALKIGPVKTTTRAAAGLHAQSRTDPGVNLTSYSPVPRVKDRIVEETVSSDEAIDKENDDLDAPILPLKLKQLKNTPTSKIVPVASSTTVLTSSPSQSLHPEPLRAKPTTLPTPSPAKEKRQASGVNQRRAKRQELARAEKSRQETEAQRNKQSSVIPFFGI